MTRATILVVEDESIVALDLQGRLAERGYLVPAIARTGEQAIQKAREIRPDLILMDINLAGDMDGIEAADQIRRHSELPVIFLTAFSDQMTLERARDAGPYGYILKPFEIENVHSAIEMAIHRHRLENELRESERRYRRLYEGSNDAIFIHTLEGKIQDVNGRGCAMLGHTRGALLHMDFQSLHPEDESDVVSGALDVLLKQGATQYESSFRRADGSRMEVDISTSIFDPDAGQVQAIVRDISDRVRAQNVLHEQKVELEARNEELNAFAYTVAHDLRGPLGLIIGYARLVEEDLRAGLGETLQKSIEVILQQGAKMDNIIEALLLLAGVRNSNVKAEPLDMQQIVSEALGRLQAMIQESQADVVLPAAWPEAVGYPLWVEEIWVNYLSNAIKYGGEPPRLELGATLVTGNGSDPSGAGGKMIRFWIKDNGVGVTPEERTRLFTPFTRLHQDRAPGHGLGLSIVKRIVKRLGGWVEVSSDGIPGRGSTFSFTLPMRVAPAGAAEQGESVALGAERAALRPAR